MINENTEFTIAVVENNSVVLDLFEKFIDGFDENKFTKEQIATRNAIQRSFNALDYILKLMRTSHSEAIRQFQNPRSEPYSGLDLDYVGQTEVHAESFYCEAHRLKKLLKSDFPGFKKLEFLPLTLVRNWVIEHTRVDRTASAWGYAYGPRLYVGSDPLCKEHPSIMDKGFYPNAIEFYQELQKTLEQALEEPI